ncbi:MAG: hypothetical protein JO149_04085 [Gammaproteobacteria bacterium]|nr:hypothetical protein [Gammaproteobacteria bacterium]
MKLQSKLIIFLFVTSFGSALSSIATFISIESYFNSLIFLGVALSIRTFASALFSYYSNHIIQRLGLSNSLFASQIFGCMALFVLLFGFYYNNFGITILGIVLTGLPSSLVSILLTIILRISAKNQELFRKYSARRELFFGIAMLLASIFSPLLLMKFNLNTVLSLDIVSYIAGIFILTKINIVQLFLENDDEKIIKLEKIAFSSAITRSFMIKTSASLILAGLLPLLASSGKIEFTMDMPLLFRQWLWAIEDVTAIFASLIYLIFVILWHQKWFDAILMLSGIWLAIPTIFTNTYTVIIALISICILTDYSGQKFRDDLIVSAKNDSNLIKAYSALAQFQRNFIYFISPIFLSILFTYTNCLISLFFIISIQIIFYITYKFKNKKIVKMKILLK